MSKVNKSWMAVVAAALLLGTLAGVVWARPNDRPGAAEPTRKITLAGADFIPATFDQGWANFGNYVRCVGPLCLFTAPVVFPSLGAVTVERIRLHVNDANGTASAIAEMYRANPSTGANVSLGSASSPPGTSGGLKTYTSSAINQVVRPSQKAYIFLHLSGTDINVYGVTVEYHRNM